MTRVLDNELQELEQQMSMHCKLVADEFGPQNLQGQSHWIIVLEYNGHKFRTKFFQGAAHRRYKHNGKRVQYAWGSKLSVHGRGQLLRSTPTKPEKLDVLYCLVSDAQCVEQDDFAEFCDNLGYCPDSVESRRIYSACCDARARLSRMFDLPRLYELFQDY